jgi:hypothetical protein
MPYIAEVLGAHAVVSKLSVCAPRTSVPKIRDMHGSIELVQGLVHFLISKLYFRTCLGVASLLGRVTGGPCPLAKAANAELTARR